MFAATSPIMAMVATTFNCFLVVFGVEAAAEGEGRSQATPATRIVSASRRLRIKRGRELGMRLGRVAEAQTEGGSTGVEWRAGAECDVSMVRLVDVSRSL